MSHFFKCCPLVWMFCSKRGNNRINKIHGRALRLLYSDYENSPSYFLATDGLFTAHHTNIQTLVLEINKIKHNLSELCLKDLFSVVNGNYNLRSQSHFGVPGIYTLFYDANLILDILDWWFGISLPYYWNVLKTFLILIYLKRQ